MGVGLLLTIWITWYIIIINFPVPSPSTGVSEALFNQELGGGEKPFIISPRDEWKGVAKSNSNLSHLIHSIILLVCFASSDKFWFSYFISVTVFLAGLAGLKLGRWSVERRRGRLKICWGCVNAVVDNDDDDLARKRGIFPLCSFKKPTPAYLPVCFHQTMNFIV